MKSRTAQLVFQTMYVSLALVACVGSVGFYDMKFTSDFYIYFTNISNYFCKTAKQIIRFTKTPSD